MVKTSTKCTVRTSKFMTNKLLKRKQFKVDVLHPGKAQLSKSEVADRLAKLYNINDQKTIFIYGLRSKFGGGKTSGFGLIYDDLKSAKKFEHKYRLIRGGMETKGEKSRKQLKERKNRGKKARGMKKDKVLNPEKK